MKNPLKTLSAIYHSWLIAKRPLRLEFVVTDYCNLNCKGCTHYSPLAANEMADFTLLSSVIRQLGQSCSQVVNNCYLIGGETLLYPRLTDAMAILRESFPYARLSIYTNGLLLPRMSDEFWESCKREKFVLSITRYPIRFDYDKVFDLCKDKGVETEMVGDRSMENSFFRFALDPRKKQQPRLSHQLCYQRGCVSVIGDKIFPCSTSGCIGHLNKAHATNFTHEKGDYLVVDEVKDAQQIKRLRDNPVPFCGYCICPPPVTHYGPSRREKSEWVND